MLLKKDFTEQTINGVHLANGTVRFNNIKLNVHCFVVDGVLIDTGARSLEKEFKPFFEKADIDQVMITHFHEDHTGCAAFLQEKRLPIFMNGLMLDVCMKKADYPIYRKVFWGKRKPFEASSIASTFTSRRSTWDVIETPGHSRDHLAFLNRGTGQLFTGDLYIQERTKVVMRDENVPVIIESLKKVLAYDFEDVFCSHAGFLKDGRAALKRKLEYLQELQEKVVSLHKKGMGPESISATLFPKKYPIISLSLGEWDSIHIIESILQAQSR
ncbi:MBL fold metallo-hydrolase [Bacillus sp. T33-2]|uniref:MBL fold metallo-hydrolase n=1 Tax=Bacillus sp. T33-2 TaxID=2054168 RepID=UPI000C7842FC|nr:MBL fold metallo-hydrolase [Bacillus sp. T33-2]PLR95954.1 MBL fold metallo-hydrolase [Bacillus sp. T33-2]